MDAKPATWFHPWSLNRHVRWKQKSKRREAVKHKKGRIDFFLSTTDWSTCCVMLFFQRLLSRASLCWWDKFFGGSSLELVERKKKVGAESFFGYCRCLADRSKREHGRQAGLQSATAARGLEDGPKKVPNSITGSVGCVRLSEVKMR
jgi:hypothetical protein